MESARVRGLCWGRGGGTPESENETRRSSSIGPTGGVTGREREVT